MRKLIFLTLFIVCTLFNSKSNAFGFEVGFGGGDYSGPGVSFGIGSPYYDPYYDVYPVYEDEVEYYE